MLLEADQLCYLLTCAFVCQSFPVIRRQTKFGKILFGSYLFLLSYYLLTLIESFVYTRTSGTSCRRQPQFTRCEARGRRRRQRRQRSWRRPVNSATSCCRSSKTHFPKSFCCFFKVVREPWSGLSGAKHSTKLIASDVLLIWRSFHFQTSTMFGRRWGRRWGISFITIRRATITQFYSAWYHYLLPPHP